jgi:hypothetical protein
MNSYPFEFRPDQTLTLSVGDPAELRDEMVIEGCKYEVVEIQIRPSETTGALVKIIHLRRVAPLMAYSEEVEAMDWPEIIGGESC